MPANRQARWRLNRRQPQPGSGKKKPMTRVQRLRAGLLATVVIGGEELVEKNKEHRGREQQEEAVSEGYEVANQRARDFLGGSNRRFRELFRMEKSSFRELVIWFKAKTDFNDGLHLTSDLQMMVVLWIFAFNEPQRNASHFFGISQNCVHHVINDLLPHFIDFHEHFVQMPDDDWLDPNIELDRNDKIFSGCWGALDGTLLKAFLPVKEQRPFFNRKTGTAQNVLALVGFDFRFHAVYTGSPGSVHDATVIRNAVRTDVFRIPRDRFYLADSRYQGVAGVTVPFTGILYHLTDWRSSYTEAGIGPKDAKEVYNYRHAHLRVTVEQIFGHMKRKWKIYRATSPEYDFDRQQMIILAITALHNFLREMEGEPDFNVNDLTEEEEAIMDERRERLVHVADRENRQENSDDWMRRKETAVMAWRQWNNR